VDTHALAHPFPTAADEAAVFSAPGPVGPAS